MSGTSLFSDRGTMRMPMDLLLCLCIACAASAFATQDPGGRGADRICLVATGLGGMPEYEENFIKWGDSLEELCRNDLGASVIRLDGREKRRQDFMAAFQEASSLLSTSGDLWLFLIGHGTYDGREYKFNISGPDLTGDDLSAFLETLPDRKSYVILGTSCSGVLVPRIGAPNRVVVAATKSGGERQPPLFLSFFLEAARSASADLDKNGMVSLREAFSFCETGAKSWYEEKGRLQTEHPLLNDSGGNDNLASITYLARPPEQSYRSLEARQLAPEKQKLEREIEELKLRKGSMSESEYFEELERLLVELALLNERISQLEGE